MCKNENFVKNTFDLTNKGRSVHVDLRRNCPTGDSTSSANSTSLVDGNVLADYLA